MKRGWWAIPATAAIFGLSTVLVFGCLAPYSPVVPGFQRQALHRIVVYAHSGETLPDRESLDALPGPVAAALGLAWHNRPSIFFCRSDREKCRLTGSASRAIAYPVYGGRIFVSQRLLRENRAGKTSLNIYLQHELAHALIGQHCSWKARLTFPAWLNEGLAMSAAAQMGTGGYYTPEETARTIAHGVFFDPAWWAQPYGRQSPEARAFSLENKYHFIYSEFACLVTDLQSVYGRDRFDRYFRALLAGGSHAAVFHETFGLSFRDYLTEFKQRMTAVARGNPASPDQ